MRTGSAAFRHWHWQRLGVSGSEQYHGDEEQSYLHRSIPFKPLIGLHATLLAWRGSTLMSRSGHQPTETPAESVENDPDATLASCITTCVGAHTDPFKCVSLSRQMLCPEPRGKA